MVILSLEIEPPDNACVHLSGEVNNEDGGKELRDGVGEKKKV